MNENEAAEAAEEEALGKEAQTRNEEAIDFGIEVVNSIVSGKRKDGREQLCDGIGAKLYIRFRS